MAQQTSPGEGRRPGNGGMCSPGPFPAPPPAPLWASPGCLAAPADNVRPKLRGETGGQRVVCPSPLAPTGTFISSLPARLHPATSPKLPREKAPLFPAPVAPAWLGDTRAPGGKVTGPRRIHLQPHQLPGNRIPAADDSRRRQDRAPIQPPLDGVARPGGRLPNLGPPTPGHRVPRASTAQTVRPPARGHGRGRRAAMHPTLGARDSAPSPRTAAGCRTERLYCSCTAVPREPPGVPPQPTPHSEYYSAPFTQQKRKAQMGRECALHADERGLAAARPAGRRPRTRSRRGGGEEGRGGGPSPQQRAAGHERAPSGPGAGNARRGGGEGADGLEAGGGQGTPAQAGPSHPDARAPPQDGTRGGQPQQEPSCPHRPPPPRGEEDPSGPRLPTPTALRRGGSDQTAQRCRDPSGLPGQSPGTPSATFTRECPAPGTEPGSVDSVGDITGAPADRPGPEGSADP
ncbi:basic salivary proline-rich protein 1-like [Delphinus delphis]|uniref:basic salivary proline-rich protein 1-like n=1 Tax=Delphinus delphis TaxID=9728 RepID=UPI00375351E9